ncbi:Mus7/MMS22 family-domain-containing protein [Lipomyces kononenkoae]|uniref:Mus7/MMS22 family-domain-containing protein n=1 Tax=Lipomyces kononenkoae TaxID=34357 RepID=A0ACC3T6S4_LIPKO
MPQSQGYVSDSEDSGSFSVSDFRDADRDELEFLPFMSISSRSKYQYKEGLTLGQPEVEVDSIPGPQRVPIDHERIIEDDAARLVQLGSGAYDPYASIAKPVTSTDPLLDSAALRLSATPPADHTHELLFTSPLSSPLSELSSPPDLDDILENFLNDNRGMKSPTSRSTETVLHEKTRASDSLAPPFVVNWEQENIDPTQYHSGPTQHFFRKRTARQINPYLFDRQMYEMALKKRGIKPIRIAVEKRISTQNNSDDSQFTPPSDTLSSQSATRLPLTQESGLTEDSMVQPPTSSLRSRQLSSRKGQHAFTSNTSRRQHQTGESKFVAQSTRATNGPLSNQVDIFEFPTSPPRRTQTQQGSRTSVSVSSLQRISATQNAQSQRAGEDTDGLDQPPFSSRMGDTTSLRGSPLYTPLHTIPVDDESQSIHSARSTSSKSGRQLIRALSIASNSDSSDESLNESDSDGEGNSSELELERLKKRVRGVLPPSFLTLENSLRREREKASYRQRSTQISALQAPKKGVARRKIGTSRREEEWNEFLGDSESDSDGPELRSQSSVLFKRPEHSVTSQHSRRHSNAVSDNDSDMEVDTHIDRMTARETRSHRRTPSSIATRMPKKSKSHQGGKLRQTRLDTRVKTKKRRSHKSSKPSLSGSNLPQIGILDAYMTEKNVNSPAPQFLKVAVREASKRDGFGRDSPSRKAFHFDDNEDNRTVSEVLQQWREGTHEGFETSSLSFARQAPVAAPSRTSSGDDSPKAIQTIRRRLPAGVIAVVAPPPGVVQVLAPPPMAKRYRQEEFVEVESGEYAVRRRPLKIDHLFESRRRIPDSVLQRYNEQRGQSRQAIDSDGVVKASHSDLKSTRKSRKAVFMPPRQHIRSEPTPSFDHIRGGDLTEVSRAEHEDFSPAFTTPAVPSPALPARSAQCKIECSQVITEFNIPILNFSATFDVFPLRHDTRFRPSTFIGRGALDAALHTLPAVEDKGGADMSIFLFQERGMTLLWKAVNAQLLEELDIGFGILLDWALCEQHNADHVSEERVDQAYEFCVFLSNYIKNTLAHESHQNIIVFVSAIKRLSVRVCELFTQFHGRITRFSRLSFYMLGFQLLYIYQIYSMLQDHSVDYSHLALDREFMTLGRLLIQVLLKYGIDDLYQFLRTYRSRVGLQIGRESTFMEIWVMAIHVFDGASRLAAGTISSFWESLYEAIGYDALSKVVNIDKFEQIWYATFSMCPLYQFDSQGVSDVGRYTAHWNAVEVMMENLLSTAEQYSRSREFGSYCRACFSRCLTLTLTWNWPGTKSLAMKMYRFFAQRKLENLESDVGTGFPDFLQDPNNLLELSTSDTVFHIFLKYLAKLIRDVNEWSDARKILPGMIGLVTPLNGRIYPRTAELRLADLEALENNYSLLLTLFWAAPPELRPPIGHLRDVIILCQSHSQARILSVKAWYYLTRLELRRNGGILESGEWYQDLVKYSLDDYLQLETVVAGISQDETKRRRANLKGYESLLKDSIKYIRMIICAPNLVQTPDQTIQILRYSRLGDVLNNGLSLPEKVMLEALQTIHDFVDLAKRILKGTNDLYSPLVQQSDSQESLYGDDSFVQHLVDDENRQWIQENRGLLAGALVDTIFNPLYQLLSNFIGASEGDKLISDELVVKAIETWSLLAQFLISSGAKDWNYFLEGRGAWKWFAETRRKARYEELWLSRVKSLQGEPEDESNGILPLA